MIEKKCAFLILAHKDIYSILSFANTKQNYNFYIHLDKKVNIKHFISCYENVPTNVFFLEDRVSVNWAGFSMVKATILLMNFAIEHDSCNEYFHLISGDDVILISEPIWNDSKIYIEFHKAGINQYRMRFNAPHADSIYQRKLVGKILTQSFKLIDKFYPSRKVYYSGSQWFSIRKEQLNCLLKSIDNDDLIFFKNKLCPDEHFFQFLIEKSGLLNHITSQGNKRYIIFDKNYQRGSSPIFLDLPELYTAKQSGYWFARKVCQKTMAKFYNEIDNESVK